MWDFTQNGKSRAMSVFRSYWNYGVLYAIIGEVEMPYESN
jgi:hypothetical protein